MKPVALRCQVHECGWPSKVSCQGHLRQGVQQIREQHARPILEGGSTTRRAIFRYISPLHPNLDSMRAHALIQMLVCT